MKLRNQQTPLTLQHCCLNYMQKQGVIEAEVNRGTDLSTEQLVEHYSCSTGCRKLEEQGLITEWRTETRDSMMPGDPTSAKVHITHQANW